MCVANVAYSPILFKAAIIWGDPEVFQWLLNARQGFIMLADYSKRVTWTAKVNLERQGLETLLCVRHGHCACGLVPANLPCVCGCRASPSDCTGSMCVPVRWRCRSSCQHS